MLIGIFYALLLVSIVLPIYVMQKDSQHKGKEPIRYMRPVLYAGYVVNALAVIASIYHIFDYYEDPELSSWIYLVSPGGLTVIASFCYLVYVFSYYKVTPEYVENNILFEKNRTNYKNIKTCYVTQGQENETSTPLCVGLRIISNKSNDPTLSFSRSYMADESFEYIIAQMVFRQDQGRWAEPNSESDQDTLNKLMCSGKTKKFTEFKI